LDKFGQALKLKCMFVGLHMAQKLRGANRSIGWSFRICKLCELEPSKPPHVSLS